MSSSGDGMWAQLSAESSINMYELLTVSQYHTKWSGYYRTYFVLVNNVYTPDYVKTSGSVLDFKRDYPLDNIVAEILSQKDKEFSIDIGHVYGFPDLIGLRDNDVLFHHEYKEGINLFLSEFKYKLDKARKLQEDQEEAHQKKIQAIEELRQKYSKVVVL